MGRDPHQNRQLPDRAAFGHKLESTLGLPFNLLELALSYLVVRPWCWMPNSIILFMLI